jgi:hypothetical protein
MVIWQNVSSTLMHTEKPNLPKIPYWLITTVIACLIPLVTNVLLPFFGISVFEQRLGATTLPTLITLALGGMLYVQYLRFSLKNPLVLAIYSAVFIRLMFYAALVMETSGKHLPARIIHMGLLVVPTVLLLFKNFTYLNKNYHYFKYLVVFYIVFLLYFFFFNYNFVEPGVSITTNTSISQGKLNDYFYTFVGLVLVSCSFQKISSLGDKFKLFQTFNLYIILFGLVHGILTLLGFPLDLFTMVLEGFRRAMGLYSHPNEYAKSQGLLLIYYIGLYYSYIRANKPELLKYRMLLIVTIISNILAFMLSMSKNSFASFGLAMGVFFVMSLADSKIRSKILMPVVIFASLLVMILIGYQVYTGHDLMATLTDRFNDNRSLEWRYSVWGYLIANINKTTVWFGHGLTASNLELYRFLFNTSKQSSEQSIFVHNALISFVYDMGIFGLLVFAGFIAAAYQGIKTYLRTHEPMMLTVTCLAIFIVVCSLVDECITFMDTSLLFWLLVTLIYSYYVTPFISQPEKKLLLNEQTE